MLAFLLVFVTLWRNIRRSLIDPEFQAAFVTLGVLLVTGTVFYHNIEGWSWINALYFCVITLATVGYGDLTPTTDAGKLFTIVYIFMGIGLLAAFFGKLAASLTDHLPDRSHHRPSMPAADTSTQQPDPALDTQRTKE
jgi:voltage-gated potassium channel Kch